MTIVLAIILITASATLGGLMLYQARQGTVELLSIRNFFLVGFILFQLVSGTLSLGFGIYGDYGIQNPPVTGAIFAAVCFLFLGLFLITYQGGWGVKRIASSLGKNYATPGWASMLTLAVAFLLAGIVLRLLLARVPVFGPLATSMGAALLAAASGMAAWAWAPRLKNPAVASVAMAIILVAIFTILYQTFGRRDIVSVIAAVLWGLYFGAWRYVSVTGMLLRLAVMATPGVLLLAAFSAVRSPDAVERAISPLAMARMLASADVQKGLIDVASGQFSAGCSMWLIENRPKEDGYDTLHTVRLFLLMPIPRDLFPAKPQALGLTQPDEMKIRRVAQNFNVGPGIVGHIFNDNPYLAAWLYPIFFGLLMRFLDEIIRRHPLNPFVVLPIGTALGQILGLPRGEVGLFLFQAITSIVTSAISMWVICRIMMSLGWRIAYDEPDGAGAYGAEDPGGGEWGSDEGGTEGALDDEADAEQLRAQARYADDDWPRSMR